MTNAALTAWAAGRAMQRAGKPLPPDTPFEGAGYWIRRGYNDHHDR